MSSSDSLTVKYTVLGLSWLLPLPALPPLEGVVLVIDDVAPFGPLLLLPPLWTFLGHASYIITPISILPTAPACCLGFHSLDAGLFFLQRQVTSDLIAASLRPKAIVPCLLYLLPGVEHLALGLEDVRGSL